LNDKKDIRREKKEKKRQKRKREEGRRFGEGTGDEASGHELSLVTTATNKKSVGNDPWLAECFKRWAE